MRLITFCFLIIVFNCCRISGQLQYMGFKDNIFHNNADHYYPKMKVISDDIYVASNSGIYKSNLINTGDNWELFAFRDIPIIDFVKNGDKILAISTGVKNSTDSTLLLSNDNGKTFINYTSPYFINEYTYNYLHCINQNPKNPNSLLILGESGLSLSADFGTNWENINPAWLQWSAAFHPLDTSHIYFTGENMFMQGTIFKSSDSGNTWDKYAGIKGGDNCVYNIMFHPHDPNILLFGGKGIIGKSTDKGNTWEINYLHDSRMFFHSLLFDEDNPNVVYASGWNGDSNNAIYIFRSTDCGNNWHLAYKENLNLNCGGVIDMVKYKNYIIFYTATNGLYKIDLETTPALSNNLIMSEPEITIYQNSEYGHFQFKSSLIVNKVDIMDMTGKMMKSIKLEKEEATIDASPLQKGFYFFIFYTGKHILTKKISLF